MTIIAIKTDHGAKSLIGQNFQQQHMRHPPVNNVHRVDAALGRVQRASNLGQHAATDGAVRKQFVNALGRQVGE